MVKSKKKRIQRGGFLSDITEEEMNQYIQTYNVLKSDNSTPEDYKKSESFLVSNFFYKNPNHFDQKTTISSETMFTSFLENKSKERQSIPFIVLDLNSSESPIKNLFSRDLYVSTDNPGNFNNIITQICNTTKPYTEYYYSNNNEQINELYLRLSTILKNYHCKVGQTNFYKAFILFDLTLKTIKLINKMILLNNRLMIIYQNILINCPTCLNFVTVTALTGNRDTMFLTLGKICSYEKLRNAGFVSMNEFSKLPVSKRKFFSLSTDKYYDIAKTAATIAGIALSVGATLPWIGGVVSVASMMLEITGVKQIIADIGSYNNLKENARNSIKSALKTITTSNQIDQMIRTASQNTPNCGDVSVSSCNNIIVQYDKDVFDNYDVYNFYLSINDSVIDWKCKTEVIPIVDETEPNDNTDVPKIQNQEVEQRTINQAEIQNLVSKMSNCDVTTLNRNEIFLKYISLTDDQKFEILSNMNVGMYNSIKERQCRADAKFGDFIKYLTQQFTKQPAEPAPVALPQLSEEDQAEVAILKSRINACPKKTQWSPETPADKFNKLDEEKQNEFIMKNKVALNKGATDNNFCNVFEQLFNQMTAGNKGGRRYRKSRRLRKRKTQKRRRRTHKRH